MSYGDRVTVAEAARSAKREMEMQTVLADDGRIDLLALRAAVVGRVIAPDDADYDHARTVFVGGIDRRPRVIVQAANEADVRVVIGLARETGLPLAVRSGGHSNGGLGVVDDGIVLDLREMRALDIDARRANRVGAARPDRGCLLRPRSASTDW